MKAFVFSLDGVLKQRSWQETEAKRLLGLEIKKAQIIENEIRMLNEELKGLVGSQSGFFNSHLQWMAFDYRTQLRNVIETKKYMLASQRNEVHNHQQDLNSAITERKKFEKLKEREFQRYREHNKRLELKIMDEISSNFQSFNASYSVDA